MDERIYSIGKRRKKRNRKKSSPFARFFLILLAVLVCLLFLLNFELAPELAAIAEANIRNRISRLINSSVEAAIQRLDYSYDDLIHLTYKSDGSIAALSAKMTTLAKLRTEIVRDALMQIKDTSLMQIKIPLGNLLGFEVFAGRGPDVKVDLMLAEGLSAYMESHFTSSGINQTLHRVVFRISITVDLLIPSQHTRFVISEAYPVAETVLLGEVPDAFTEIHRLTDEITEEEIDDIFDFGAHEG